VRAAIVGAGLSGLMAARTLTASGHDVVLFDKGRSPGGRLATRRIGNARVDHGAQFFTTRDPLFAALVQQWIDSGVVYEWCRGFAADGEGDGFARYAVRGGMNALAKHLAHGLDVRCRSLVFGIVRRDHGWRVTLDDASFTDIDALVVTCPLPQTFSLLFGAEVAMPETLWRTDYDRTLSLLAVLDGPGSVPHPGGVQGDSVFTFIGDNRAKGISAAPALTFHANATWSEAHWDQHSATTLDALTELARPWFGGADVVERQLKRWRFATPRSIWPEQCWQPDGVGTLAVAGDAFAGPRVEGAALSGIAAAHAVMAPMRPTA
jgi:hypothetical protein